VKRRGLFKFLFGLGLGVVVVETYERLYSIPALERAFRKEIEYWLGQYLDAKRKSEELSSRLKAKEEEIDVLHRDVSYWRSRYSSMQDEVSELNAKVGELSSKLNEANEKIYSLEVELGDWKSKYESTREEANRLKSIIGSMDELEGESLDAISYYREKMNEAIDNLKRTIEKYRVVLGDDRVAFESSTVKILEDLKLTQEKLQKVLPYFPLILNFAWKPTKVFNDKIYDINVVFEVISPLSSLEYVEVTLRPIEYKYFITMYGMREEDYNKVFPEEDVRIVRIKPLQTGRMVFSVDFKDLKGGREYAIEVRVRDVAGNEKRVAMKTPYIRQFENFGKELYDKGIIVAATYSGWYKIDKDSWGNYKYKGEVLLGEYSSLDKMVATKHIDFMTGYGINTIFIGWPPAWGKGRIDRVIENLTKSDLGRQIHYSVLYGHDENINLDDSTVTNNISQQITYLLKLIPDDAFLKFDYRPVIYFYDLPAYKGDIPTGIDKIRLGVKNLTGTNIFIIADYAKFDAEDTLLPIIKKLDGVTVWAAHYDSSGYYGGVYNYEVWYEKRTLEWNNWLKEKIQKGDLPSTFVYMPSVIPEFDSRYADFGDPNQVILPRDPNRFARQLDLALSNSLPRKMVRIDTWDDWYESTVIEPSRRWLFEYLQLVKDIVLSSK
jgi:uncharacterized coiled-coil DUF342 family protein